MPLSASLRLSQVTGHWVTQSVNTELGGHSGWRVSGRLSPNVSLEHDHSAPIHVLQECAANFYCILFLVVRQNTIIKITTHDSS